MPTPTPAAKAKPRLAFFGATGPCTNACLAAALEQGYTCTALARSPAKLREKLLARDLNAKLLSSHLSILQGDVRYIDAVKAAIKGADVIVSGVGAYPTFQWSLRKPLRVDDGMVCTDATKTILRACQALDAEGEGKKPVLVVISTAGVQERDKPRAQPLAYLPWYDWLLADPLADKVGMEETILSHMGLSEAERGIGGYVIVKPSLLTNGKKGKVEDVRAGTGEEPPVGYSIDREMVGLWMFRRLIEEGGLSGVWRNERVTVTY